MTARPPRFDSGQDEKGAWMAPVFLWLSLEGDGLEDGREKAHMAPKKYLENTDL